MGAFIAFSTQDSLWGQILFTFFGILVGCVLLAAIGKNFCRQAGRRHYPCGC